MKINFEKFKILEKQTEYQDYMGYLLRNYSNIPLNKEQSSQVIKLILRSYGIKYNLGDTIDLPEFKMKDRVRFADYFDSFLKSTDIRGHNFEGLICGFFDGKLAESKSSKFDLTIKDKRYSVKFNLPGNAPEVGKFKDIIKKNNLDDIVNKYGGLPSLFANDKLDDLKKKIWDIITVDIDAWILGYEMSGKNDPDERTKIALNVIEKDEMFLIMSNFSGSPKGGYKDYYALAVKATYRNSGFKFKQSHIIVPKLTLEDLKAETDLNKEWARDVFGMKWANRIRPDVLTYIKQNKDAIITKLKNLPD